MPVELAEHSFVFWLHESMSLPINDSENKAKEEIL